MCEFDDLIHAVRRDVTEALEKRGIYLSPFQVMPTILRCWYENHNLDVDRIAKDLRRQHGQAD